MLEYVGRYRVLAEINDKNELVEEDLYVECLRGSHLYRYSDTHLALYVPVTPTAKKWYKEIGAVTDVSLVGSDDISVETIMKFPEKDIKKVEKIIKPRPRGKTIHPSSPRNLEQDRGANYEIKYPRLYKDLQEKLRAKKMKMHEYRPFYEELSAKIDINLSEEANSHGLKIPEYIDYKNLYKIVAEHI